MNLTDWLGSIGVTILLAAYFLNLWHKIHSDSIIYISLNCLGSGLALGASILLNYIPFVILEAVWCSVSLIALIKKIRIKNQ